jgi:hypothetical protein
MGIIGEWAFQVKKVKGASLFHAAVQQYNFLTGKLFFAINFGLNMQNFITAPTLQHS